MNTPWHAHLWCGHINTQTQHQKFHSNPRCCTIRPCRPHRTRVLLYIKVFLDWPCAVEQHKPRHQLGVVSSQAGTDKATNGVASGDTGSTDHLQYKVPAQRHITRMCDGEGEVRSKPCSSLYAQREVTVYDL